VLNGVKQFALIFASSLLLSVFQNDTSFLFADATFWTCPRPFEQVLNIMCNYKGVVLPVVHVMMTCKATGLYIEVFKRLRALFQLDPSMINTDFEAALTKALKDVFPNAKIHGCFFHFAQAVFRAIMGPSKMKFLIIASFGICFPSKFLASIFTSNRFSCFKIPSNAISSLATALLTNVI
jgi:MULE transposase domain